MHDKEEKNRDSATVDQKDEKNRDSAKVLSHLATMPAPHEAEQASI